MWRWGFGGDSVVGVETPPNGISILVRETPEPSLRLLPARRRGEGANHLGGASTLDFQPPEGRHRYLWIINHPDCGVSLQRPEQTKPGVEWAGVGWGAGPAGEDTEEPGPDKQAGVSGTWGAPRSSAHTQGKVLNTSCLSK